MLSPSFTSIYKQDFVWQVLFGFDPKETTEILPGREDIFHRISHFVFLPLYLIGATNPYIIHLSISSKGARASKLSWVNDFSLRYSPDFTCAGGFEKLSNFWERITELSKRTLEILWYLILVHISN